MVYNPHPLANIFPLMAADEYVALKSDIRQYGLREAIWILDGQILDGRNRFKACQEVGVAPILKEYEGEDPAAFVVSLNLKRRHLSESQRAMVAAKLANVTKADAGRMGAEVSHGLASANLQLPKTTSAEAASLLNVSPRSVATAKKVEEQAEPELVEAVANGQVSVSAAAMATALPREEQQAIMAEIEQGGKPSEVIKNHVLATKHTGDEESYTPKEYLASARTVMGAIDLDPASNPMAQENVGADRYFTVDDDGLTQEWAGKVWMNPRNFNGGIYPNVIQFIYENTAMSNVRRPDEWNGKAMPYLHENEAAAYKENLHAMLAGITEHSRSFYWENCKGKVVFRLLQRMRAGKCENQASTTKVRSSRKGKITDREAEIQRKRERAFSEKIQNESRQSHQKITQVSHTISVEQGFMDKMFIYLGRGMRVLWKSRYDDAGSLYPARTSRMSRHSARKHGPFMLGVQYVKRVASSEGMGWRASVCTDC